MITLCTGVIKVINWLKQPIFDVSGSKMKHQPWPSAVLEIQPSVSSTKKQQIKKATITTLGKKHETAPNRCWFNTSNLHFGKVFNIPDRYSMCNIIKEETCFNQIDHHTESVQNWTMIHDSRENWVFVILNTSLWHILDTTPSTSMWKTSALSISQKT